MKKFLSIIISFILLCPIFIFTACTNNKEKRTLTNFYDNYLSIAEKHQSLKKEVVPERFNNSKTIYKVGFVYSDDLQYKLAESSSSYAYLDSYYNLMLDDALAPTYLYGSSMFAGTAKFSEDDKTSLYKKLDKLSTAYIETAHRVYDLEKTLTNSSTSLENLQKLFTSYEELIKLACDLSIKVSNLYYNKVLRNANPTYSSTDQNTILNIANQAINRLFYYKTLYLDIYLNTQVIGNNVATKIISSTSFNPFDITYEPYTSLKNTSYTTRKPTYLIMGHAGDLLTLGKTLHNIQLTLEDEYNKYDEAINDIIYQQTDSSSTLKDYNKKLIIDKFILENGIIYNSFHTLTDILDLCYNKA